MNARFTDLLQFLSENLIKKGFEITCSVNMNREKLPVIDGHSPDLIATYKNVKTVYGKVELPEDVLTKEQWDRLRALSDEKSTELYIAFPEEEKMHLVFSLINGKLSDRTNIIKIYK